jgi:hypothetical protein
MKFGPSPKSYYTMDLCRLFCLYLKAQKETSKSKAFVDIIWSSSDLRDTSNLPDLFCTDDDLYSQMVYIFKILGNNWMRFV